MGLLLSSRQITRLSPSFHSLSLPLLHSAALLFFNLVFFIIFYSTCSDSEMRHFIWSAHTLSVTCYMRVLNSTNPIPGFILDKLLMSIFFSWLQTTLQTKINGLFMDITMETELVEGKSKYDKVFNMSPETSYCSNPAITCRLLHGIWVGIWASTLVFAGGRQYNRNPPCERIWTSES